MEKKLNGYILSPLTSIEFWKACVDLLHMLLRITDKLELLLINKLSVLDNGKDNEDLTDKPNLSRYINFLSYDCKISRPYYISGKKIEFRSLTGADKLEILEKIDLIELFPKLQDVKKIDHLWKDFFNIYCSVKINSYGAQDLKEATKKWINYFIKVHQSVNVTPYMHTFGQHLWEMVKLHGDISLYTMQGL